MGLRRLLLHRFRLSCWLKEAVDVLRYVADRRTADEGAHTNAPILLHRSHITLVEMSTFDPKTQDFRVT